MKRYLFSLIWIVALVQIHAQERPSFTDARWDYFTTDIHNHLYLWKDGFLSLYEIEGNHLADYSSPKDGNITTVSANLGTKILLFHQEAGSIQLLDNKLLPITKPLNLFDKSLFSISLAALLGTSQIVLYDEANQDLLITDLNLNILNKTHCDFSKNFAPQLLKINSEKEILLVDSISGVYFFDTFGTFVKKIALPHIEDAQLFKNTLIFLKNNHLHSYHLLTLEHNDIEMVASYAIKAFELTRFYSIFLDKNGHIHLEKNIID